MSELNPTIKESVLQKISAERVTPTSKWYFRAQHAALWLPGILVTVLGSFAIAGILFSTVHSGWQYRDFVHESVTGFISQVVPLLWFGSLVLFGAIIVKTLRLTARGYRYKTGALLLISFLTSIVLGAALFALDTVSGRGNPVIRFQAERVQQMIWTNPLEGRLAGVIDTEDELVTLTDTTGKRWVLNTREAFHPELLVDDQSVRVFGTILTDDTFLACVVLPWDLSPLPHPHSDAPLPARSPQKVSLSKRCEDILRGQVAPLPERNTPVHP